MFLGYLFVQNRGTSKSRRKPWYRRAIEATSLWKSPAGSPGRQRAEPTGGRLKKSSSLRAATTSFTRACLCAPVSHGDVLFAAPPPQPRRSTSFPRSRPAAPRAERAPAPVPRASAVDPRRVFRGKSLTDDALMRRLVVDEATAAQCLRRRNQMEFVKRRMAARRRRLGPSPLSRMTMAGEDRGVLQ